MRSMPGTNLTRDEAQTRARLLAVDSYTVELDLTTSETTFASTTTLEFSCTEPGADTFADLVADEVHEIVLNGTPLDPATAYADSRIQLSDLAASNTLVVRAECRYTNSGEGMHRFVDPADGRVYLYSQFEVPDARRVFTTFEQPDLKATFTFHVTAPDHWKVVSNTPTPAPEPVREGAAVWRFPTTKRMSTYITAVVAGEYHEVRDVYEGPHGTYELGHYCRQSMVHGLDHEWIGATTKAGFAWFEEHFGPYPFEKYDQLWVPEYNMGAMENAGCVTINDDYLPTSRLSKAIHEYRASVILHELAHMWFGNLVTMRWWEDLWLNESFAEWACYWAEAEITEFTDAWTGFANARKQRGYRQDQMPSTHPIATEILDLQAIEVNFDMITYAKGAAVLKQLVAWVGLEPFLAGLRQYFADHSYDNAEFSDLLAALEKSSGRELQGWAREWLQTAEVNTLAPAFEVDGEGAFTSFAVQQTAPEAHPTLRRHRIGIGLYDRVTGEDGSTRVVRRDAVEVDVEGARTEIPELVGQRQPDLLLLNDEDLTYAKIVLDDRSLATAKAHLSSVEDSLARALCWSAAWHMTRDARMSATEYVDLVLTHIGAETDAWGVSRIPTYAALALNAFADPERRPDLQARWERGLRKLLDEAPAGDERQLSFLHAYTATARSAEAVADLEALLDGELVLDGLEMDQALRWSLITGLARSGNAGNRIAEELERDPSNSGREYAAAARTARPTAEAKAEAWQRLAHDTTTPNATRKLMAKAFNVGDQTGVLAPYLDAYLGEAAALWERFGRHMASDVLEYTFPRYLASEDAVAKVDAWLESTSADPAAVRFVREGRADMVRNLAAQAFDARQR